MLQSPGTSLSDSSKLSISYIELIIEKLKANQTRESTACNYLSIWHKFNKFLMRLEVIPKNWEQRVAYYAAVLVHEGVQSSTLKSYISAIKTTLCTDGYHWQDDFCELGGIIKACRIQNDEVKIRLPINKGLLELIMFQLNTIYDHQPYLEALYKAMIVLGYYGLMSVGELTSSQHTLKAKDIHIGINKDKILMVLYSSKTHDKHNMPQQIKISSIQNKKDNAAAARIFCPFMLVRQYAAMRGNYLTDEEPFFVFTTRIPVKANNLREVLRIALKRLNLNASLYDTHPVRIGRNCDLFKIGINIERIKWIGLWKSNSVYRYIKCSL